MRLHPFSVPLGAVLAAVVFVASFSCGASSPDGVATVKVLRVDEFEQVLPGAEDTSDVWNVCLCKVLKSNVPGSEAVDAESLGVLVFRNPGDGGDPNRGQAGVQVQVGNPYEAHVKVWGNHVHGGKPSDGGEVHFIDVALDMAFAHWHVVEDDTMPPVWVAVEPDGVQAAEWGPTLEELTAHDPSEL